MGEYIVQAHQLAFNPDTTDGQKPHEIHSQGAVVELDDEDAQTSVLVKQGSLKSKRAYDQEQQAAQAGQQLDGQVQGSTEQSGGQGKAQASQKTS